MALFLVQSAVTPAHTGNGGTHVGANHLCVHGVVAVKAVPLSWSAWVSG